MEQAYTADMPEIIGDDPGSPDVVWGGKRLHLGPLLDIFVCENVMGTSERQERLIAAFFHKPSETVDHQMLQNLLEPGSDVPVGLAGAVGLLRLVQGMSGRPKGTLEIFASDKHVSLSVPPTLPFDIRSMHESKMAVRSVLESPKARAIGSSIIVGAAATAAFARLKQVRQQRKHSEPS
jgi:hypothetical protein